MVAVLMAWYAISFAGLGGVVPLENQPQPVKCQIGFNGRDNGSFFGNDISQTASDDHRALLAEFFVHARHNALYQPRIADEYACLHVVHGVAGNNTGWSYEFDLVEASCQ